MIVENLEKNIQLLPEYLQLEVSDYVEYLLIKYQVQKNKNDIPEEHKKILKERYKKMLENPTAGESWDTVKKELIQKYAV
ncbi:MAG: hypothetical protein DRI95_05395 [Bacteroidetes bacterium]|nr:MAG: hypothetical protein DRI95_05395 [Bacteroidota bacterium]RLD78990.1 MAG: hypothetical protein DRJ07_12405 [Bacteroidota bacterium]